VPVPVPGEVERIIRWVEVVTGMELSPEGAASSLDDATWQKRREDLARLGGPPVDAGSSETDPAWAYAGAVECAQQSRWPAALVLLDRHLATQPQDWLAHVLRTRAHLQLDQKSQAAADLARAFELGPVPQVNAWYRIHVAELMADKQWDRALWYLDRLIEVQSGDWTLYDRRGRVQVELGAWDKAEADHAQARALNPTDSEFFTDWGHRFAWRDRWDKAAADFTQARALGDPDSRTGVALALARLQLGDVAGYRQACADLLQRLNKDDHPSVVHRTAWVSVLRPDTLDDWTPVLDVVEKANAVLDQLTTPSTTSVKSLRQTIQAAILYRMGRFEDVVRILEPALKDSTTAFPLQVPYFLAMAHHRLGHTDEARHWLDKAVQETDRQINNRRPTSPSYPSQWGLFVQYQPLRREAEALILGKVPPSPGTP
jgi:tetratricopeptide (TPR) repeat protein